MVEGAGGALELGLYAASRYRPLAMLALSLGPMLALAIGGLWPNPTIPLRPLTPFWIMATLSFGLLYFVRLSVDQAWVGFRAGQMILVVLPALAARFVALGWTSGRRLTTLTAIVLALVAGVPTTAIDEYNASDIDNLAMGPGFPWTIRVSPEQQAALRWVRTNTPPGAIVQMDPTVRERSTWSLIPSFAERRMAAGLPISLLNVPAYAERSNLVRTMYDTADPAEASRIAHLLQIDYVYADAVERQAHAAAAKFDRSPQYFEPVFHRGDVGVYRVR
jgi:hypothetical protein